MGLLNNVSNWVLGRDGPPPTSPQPMAAAMGDQLMPTWEEGEEGGRMVLSMGPQHPSTHGVLRLEVELEGERVVKVQPDVGYLHTGIEKTFERLRFDQGTTLTPRTDYLSPMVPHDRKPLGAPQGRVTALARPRRLRPCFRPQTLDEHRGWRR